MFIYFIDQIHFCAIPYLIIQTCVKNKTSLQIKNLKRIHICVNLKNNKAIVLCIIFSVQFFISTNTETN